MAQFIFIVTVFDFKMALSFDPVRVVGLTKISNGCSESDYEGCEYLVDLRVGLRIYTKPENLREHHEENYVDEEENGEGNHITEGQPDHFDQESIFIENSQEIHDFVQS